MWEHKQELEELHRDINERDQKIDEICEDYDVRIQV
jgi:hypothetical protein